MNYKNWQKKKIIASQAHQEEIFNQLNNQNYIERSGKKIILEDNKKYTEFVSCSYLGLDQDYRLLNCVNTNISSVGFIFPSSRSRIKYKGLDDLQDLLNQIFEANTVVFSTTHLAHLGLIPLIASGEMPSVTLAPNGCVFLLDHAVHASIQINRGLMQQFGQVEILDLHDLTQLEAKLKIISNNNQTPLLFTDSICSMGGMLPLENLMQLTNKYSGYLYLDDAHGMSVYGKHGAGYVMHIFNHKLPDRLILTTSLGKGFGTCGGLVVLKSKEAANFIKMYSSTYMFSGTLANPLISACLESSKIHLSSEITFLQKQLSENVALFDTLIKDKTKVINFNCNTPIRGIKIGDEFDAIKAGLHLKESGYLGVVATYPIREKGKAIIRLLICSNHTKEDIQQICTLINLTF